MPPVDRRIVSASREVRADSGRIFELIADPSRQPEWDGNDNLAYAAPGQRVRSVGDEGRVIAWKPAEPGRPPVGHLWRWEVEPIDDARSIVVHTYDWTDLRDESRYERARATTSERLAASIDRLAALAETPRWTSTDTDQSPALSRTTRTEQGA